MNKAQTAKPMSDVAFEGLPFLDRKQRHHARCDEIPYIGRLDSGIAFTLRGP